MTFCLYRVTPQPLEQRQCTNFIRLGESYR